jgi:hypothetical protein
MATTTNYGWTTPDDTALVKDGAAAIRTLGSSVDTTTKALNPSTTLGDIEYRSSTANTNTRLGIGSSGQVLTVAAGVPSWATPTDQTPLTTKGDIFTFSTVDARLGIGANNTVLTADSAEATGLKWATPAAASGPAFRVYRATSNQTTTEDAYTKIEFNAESFDTDNCFDSTTNYRFTPNKSGYYQFNCTLRAETNEDMLVAIFKNGSLIANLSAFTLTTTRASGGSDIAYANGTTDYFEIFAYLSSAGTRSVKTEPETTFFSGIWIRS